MGKLAGFVPLGADGLLKPRNGFIFLTLGHQVRANIVVRISELGIHFNGALTKFNR